MSNMSKRRQSSSDGGGGANWMDTYGDMITLLFTFFVLLYSFSVVDIQKLKEFSQSFSSANTVVVAIPAPYSPFDVSDVMDSPIEQLATSGAEDEEESKEDLAQKADETFRELVESVNEFVDEHDIEAEVIPSYAEYTLILRFNERVFFDPGSAVILFEARSTLEAMIALIEELQPFYKMLRIEGHTDNVPISTSQYPDNWALSQGRSSSVLRYLLARANNIDLTKITISGYSEYHPIDTNDTTEGKAKNRRVDFVVEGYRD